MANILSNLFKSKVNVVQGTDKLYEERIQLLSNGNTFQDSNAINISTVYTCVKILSDTISRLPLNVYNETAKDGRTVDKNDYRYNLLHYNPNNYTTSQTFFAALEYFRNLHGNAFARIHRNEANGRVISLELLPNSLVKGYSIVNNQLYYIIKENDNTSEINADDMLHFKMITSDGIWGCNPIEALRMNLSTTWKGLKTIDSFYTNNAVSPKALKSTIPEAAFRAKQKEAVIDFKTKYAGAANAGEMIILPEFTEIQELSLSMVDAEFINTIKYNANQIASLYGVPVNMVGNFEFSKYNNVEQAALDFKQNTINSIGRMYRQELEFKLLSLQERLTGKSIEFNYMSMIETDVKTRLESYKTLLSLGVMTPNDIAKLEGHTAYSLGDDHYMSTTLKSIESKPSGEAIS